MKIIVKPIIEEEEMIVLFNTLFNAIVKGDHVTVTNLFLNQDYKIAQSTTALFLTIFLNLFQRQIEEKGLPQQPNVAFLYGKLFSFLLTDSPVDSFQQYFKNYTNFAIRDIFECFYHFFVYIKNTKNTFLSGKMHKYH